MWAKKHNLITSSTLKEGYIATSMTSKEVKNLSRSAKIHGKHKPYCLDFGKCGDEVNLEKLEGEYAKETDYCISYDDVCGAGAD